MNRLLKNRKSARKSRKRRKAELVTLKEEIDQLKRINEQLIEKIRKYEGDESRSEESKGGSIMQPPSQLQQLRPIQIDKPLDREQPTNKSESICPSILKPLALHPVGPF